MAHLADYVVRQFISGQVFFLGMALCLLGGALRAFCARPRNRTLARLTVLIGVILVVLSAAPFPTWEYGLFFLLLALLMFRPAKPERCSWAPASPSPQPLGRKGPERIRALPPW